MEERNIVGEKTQKKNSSIGYIVLVLIIIGLAGFILYDNVIENSNKLDEKPNKDNVIENSNKLDEKPNNTENNIQNKDNVYNNIYGFAYVSKDDNNYRMMALNSNGSDIELNSGQGRITFYIKNNKLLFVNTRANSNNVSHVQKVYYIDLNDKSYKPVELASGIGIYDYFDFNSDYLFSRNGLGEIIKYDFKTKEKTVIEKDIYANGFFINDNKLYYYYTDYSFTNSSEPIVMYYYIDFNGNNKTKVSKEEYEQIVSKSGYKDEIETYDDEYFIKNNKKIHIDNNLQNLYMDDKIIYTASNTTRSIVLEYTEEANKVYFKEVTMDTGEVPEKSYCYNLDNNQLEEISNETAYSFREIIK